jgi:hypothetical protein
VSQFEWASTSSARTGEEYVTSARSISVRPELLSSKVLQPWQDFRR